PRGGEHPAPAHSAPSTWHLALEHPAIERESVRLCPRRHAGGGDWQLAVAGRAAARPRTGERAEERNHLRLHAAHLTPVAVPRGPPRAPRSPARRAEELLPGAGRCPRGRDARGLTQHRPCRRPRGRRRSGTSRSIRARGTRAGSSTMRSLLLFGFIAAASTAAAQTVELRTSGGSTIEFMAGEPMVGAIVAGAPYSGEATTTTSQTLADGTRIERTSSTRVYRDSEGRMRREQTVQGLGALNPAGETTVITIVDPVAGVSYVLDPIS